ncbi:MAG: zf-TFIIB domain-containing protein [Polyangiaceae bacterium]|nr:zf-TFIIB domain-containing protein [Polyangiaceae bacterium]
MDDEPEATMLCPRCNAPLATLGVTRGRANGCERCRGLWLDDAAAESLLDEGADALAARAAQVRPDHDEAHTSCCPACSRPMDKVELHYVQVDRCIGHGMWLDAGELEFIARNIVAMRAERAAEARLTAGQRYAKNARVMNHALHSALHRDTDSDPGSDAD